MPELSGGDVEAYTQGRLPAGDAETLRLLAAALAGARRYCGWHVTPEKEDHEVEIDGPGTHLLVIPTMALTELQQVTENGEDLNLDDLEWSRRGLVRKKIPVCRWTHALGGITVKITHGYAEADAADWRGAVLAAVDLASQLGAGYAEKIGPFSYAAMETAVEAQKAFGLYRLEGLA